MLLAHGDRKKLLFIELPFPYTMTKLLVDYRMKDWSKDEDIKGTHRGRLHELKVSRKNWLNQELVKFEARVNQLQMKQVMGLEGFQKNNFTKPFGNYIINYIQNELWKRNKEFWW